MYRKSFMAPLSAALSAFVFYRLPLFGYEIPWIVLWLAVAASANASERSL